MKRGKVFVITGPSGVGKSTVTTALLKRVRNLVRLKTYTTRRPRPHEKSDADYRFISLDQFRKLKNQDAFFEFAEVYGNWYGSSREELERLRASGKNILLTLDVRGARTFKERLPDAKIIFLRPDNPRALRERLVHRGTTSPAELTRRTAELEAELAWSESADTIVTNPEGAVASAVDAAERFMADNGS